MEPPWCPRRGVTWCYWCLSKARPKVPQSPNIQKRNIPGKYLCLIWGCWRRKFTEKKWDPWSILHEALVLVGPFPSCRSYVGSRRLTGGHHAPASQPSILMDQTALMRGYGFSAQCQPWKDAITNQPVLVRAVQGNRTNRTCIYVEWDIF